MDHGTYSKSSAQEMVLEKLLCLFKKFSVKQVYLKKLSPNDNSKNQPYFGPHLTDLSFLPSGDIEASKSESNKAISGREKIKYQASLDLTWVDGSGNIYPAPNAKLIYYPQYPEVRFSGFMRGSGIDISYWMSPAKKGRSPDRWLILGVNDSQKIFSYLATPDSYLASELNSMSLAPNYGVFSKIAISNRQVEIGTKQILFNKLAEIYQMGWINGQKLDKQGISKAYMAPNGGGYTLEALLGITPNGSSAPDYLGWEIKQFGVQAFPDKAAKQTTLMTPEPNGGIYCTDGPIQCVKIYGYPDKRGRLDRLNIGGKHLHGKRCNSTALTLKIDGFDHEKRRITKAEGSILLLDDNSKVAMSWSFEKILNHWKKKHSQAAYIPCLMKRVQNNTQYMFGSCIKLGVGTNFELFLSAVIDGYVFYDPGIKLENLSSDNSLLKRRSQFRIYHKNLKQLYEKFELHDISMSI